MAPAAHAEEQGRDTKYISCTSQIFLATSEYSFCNKDLHECTTAVTEWILQTVHSFIS